MNSLLQNTNQINSGTYQLYFSLRKDTTIFLPKFGGITFPNGIYIYTGSAQKNLLQRINRHLRKRNKKQFWHIDFLLMVPEVKVFLIKIYREKKKTECKVNLQTQKQLNAEIILQGFGSSDCNLCQSHLLFVRKSIEF